MASALLSPVEAAKSKSDFARAPAPRRTGAGAIPNISHFLGAAGNMAIQRAASGPLAHNPAAPAILGGANMATGGCSCGGTCDECKKKQVQRKADAGVTAVPSAFEGALARSGLGAPLGPHTRSTMESRFGNPFDDVRIHDDSSAADAAHHISAHAFTMGRDVYFGAGRYQPHTTGGQKLLAHELTHVLQQRRGVVAGGMKSLNATSHDDVFEREAEQVESSFDKAEHAGSTPLSALHSTHGPSVGATSHVQRKCACGGTCSQCSTKTPENLSQELKKATLQRKAAAFHEPSSSTTGEPGSVGRAPAEKSIQRKCACGGTCSKCSGRSAAEVEEPKKQPLQRKTSAADLHQDHSGHDSTRESNGISTIAEQPIQRKCACGASELRPEEESKTTPVQRKADPRFESLQDKLIPAAARYENAARKDTQASLGAKSSHRSTSRPIGQPASHQATTGSNARAVTAGRKGSTPLQRSPAAGLSVGSSHDRFEREAEAASTEVAQGGHVASDKLSKLDRESIQPRSWEFCNPLTDDECGVKSTAKVVAGEAEDIAREVWDEAKQLANAVHGVLEKIDNLLVVTIPPMHVCSPHSLQFSLSELSFDIPFLEGAIPVAEVLEIYGELGLHLGITPEISLQIGPCETHEIKIAIHPVSLEAEASGGMDITLAVGLGAEARVGIFGEVGVILTWPEPPIIVQVPVAHIEAGIAGFVRGIAADHLSFDISTSAGLSGFTFSASRTDDIGLALDTGLAGYGALSVLGQNLCTLYWPFFEDHKDTVLSLGFGLGLDVSGGSPSLDISADEPAFDQLNWDDLGIKISRDMFKNDCPLCDFMRSLGLMPSQIGGPWPFHPTPAWPGPLAGVYPINPGDITKGWHGGLCRGACGLDCSKCKDIGDVFVCEPVGKRHRIWKYSHFNVCPTADGCRDHDACYDWCANKLFERGPLGVIFGPCHRMCDFECACDHGLPRCVNWIFGKGGDDIMEFSERPKEIGGCDGPCPKGTKGPTGATTLQTCLPDIELFERVADSTSFFRKTPKFPVIAPLIFEVYGIPLVVTVEAFASFEAFLGWGLGPAVLKNACLDLDLPSGDYKGTAELHVGTDINGLIQIIGGLDAELTVACLISVLKLKPKLLATGTGKFELPLVAKVEISCCGGDPVLKGSVALLPALKLAFDLDAALDVDLFGFNLFSEIWNLVHKEWKGSWPIEFDVFSLGSCGKGAARPIMTAGASPSGMMFVGGGAGAAPKPPLAAPSGGAGAHPAIGGATLGPHDLNDKTLLKDLFAMAAHSDKVPDFPADPASDHHMTNPCPVPSAPTGFSCADAIHMRWFKPNDIYPNPIKLDGISYAMVGPKPAPAPDAHQNVGVAPPFMPFIGKCLELDPQPRVGNQGRHRALLERHGFDWNSPTPMQADHVQDVFWKGPDAFDNLWPLDSFKNQSAGSRQNLHQEIRFAETAGGPTKVMSLKEFKKTKWEPDPSHERRFFKIDEIAF